MGIRTIRSTAPTKTHKRINFSNVKRASGNYGLNLNTGNMTNIGFALSMYDPATRRTKLALFLNSKLTKIRRNLNNKRRQNIRRKIINKLKM